MRLVTLFLLTVAFAASHASIENSIVKTSSAKCTGGSSFKGSGTLFWHDSKAYVLTSDHVILHGNKGFCHSVFLPKLKKEMKATFLAAEWGLGLALLSVEELTDQSFGISWEELKAPTEFKKGDPVLSYGFPVNNDTLTIDETGAIESVAIEKPFYLFQKTLTHITGANAEFGMSGGATFTKDMNRFVGVLSHQKLDPIGTSNELFVVPAKTATQWTDRYLKSPANFKIYFMEHPEGQLNNEFALLSHEFLIQAFELEGGFSASFRHISKECDVYDLIFEKGFNFALYSEGDSPFGKLVDYVKGLPHEWGEVLATIRLFLENEPNHPLVFDYFADWFRALERPKISARSRVALFHSERAEPLRRWAGHFERVASDAKSICKPNELCNTFFKKVFHFGNRVTNVPAHPEVIPGTIVAKEFFTFEWLWERKEEVRPLLRDPLYAPVWSHLEKESYSKKKALLDMLVDIEHVLFVDEIKF